jgi:hypothetical protein
MQFFMSYQIVSPGKASPTILEHKQKISDEPVWYEKLKTFYGKFHTLTFQTKMPPQLRTALKAQSTDGTQVGPLAQNSPSRLCVFVSIVGGTSARRICLRRRGKPISLIWCES